MDRKKEKSLSQTYRYIERKNEIERKKERKKESKFIGRETDGMKVKKKTE